MAIVTKYCSGLVPSNLSNKCHQTCAVREQLALESINECGQCLSLNLFTEIMVTVWKQSWCASLATTKRYYYVASPMLSSFQPTPHSVWKTTRSFTSPVRAERVSGAYLGPHKRGTAMPAKPVLTTSALEKANIENQQDLGSARTREWGKKKMILSSPSGVLYHQVF